MQDAIQTLKSAQGAARSARKKGDALRGRRPEAEVGAAYDVGVRALERGIDAVTAQRAHIEAVPAAAASDDVREFASQLAESLGALAGLRQRTGRAEDALSSYSEGAALERQFGMASTYNRMNEVRQTLLLRDDVTLAQLEPAIEALAAQIGTSLNDAAMANSGWAWADLADCLALLGRIDDGARTAYEIFVDKAESKSPERTLEMLRQIWARLQQRGDPGAPRLEAAIAALQARLDSR